MTILALEFSSLQRSVAVLCQGSATTPEGDDSQIQRPAALNSELQTLTSALQTTALPPMAGREVSSEVIEAGGGHAMKPLGMIEDALRQAGVEREAIECLAIGLGPGSYTGIRAAIALAQGWQLACGVKLLGVSSAEAIAAEAEAAGLRGRVTVVLDAQRNEFYVAMWEIGAGERREVEPLRLAGREEVQRHTEAGERVIGPEVTQWFPSGRLIFPRAAVVARLAWGRPDFMPGEKLEPIYLRETQFVKAPPPRVLPV